MVRGFICAGLILIVLSGFAHAQGSDTGSWISRAPLPTPRQEMPHAVLDGKVYVIGGLDSNSAGSTVVEVFDPTTNTWETKAEMPVPLHHHTVVAFDGKLYVLGGYQRNTFSSTTHLFVYDPETDAWTQLDPMPTSRGAHAAAVLNGKIFLTGGVSLGQPVRSVDAYDPFAGTWETLSPMNVVREHHTAAVVDSSLYVIGGRVPGLGNIGQVESYDPKTDTWSSRSPMPTARSGLASAAFNGRIFVFGGEIPGVYTENEMYDPSTDTWETMAPIPTGRHGTGAGVVGDTIFVIGGAPIQGFGQTNVNQGFVPPASIITHTSLEEIPESDLKIEIYPNPASVSATVRLVSGRQGPVSATVTMVDLLGRIVRIANADVTPGSSTEIRLRTAGLPSGVYFVRTNVSLKQSEGRDLARETVGSVVLMSRQ